MKMHDSNFLEELNIKKSEKLNGCSAPNEVYTADSEENINKNIHISEQIAIKRRLRGFTAAICLIFILLTSTLFAYLTIYCNSIESNSPNGGRYSSQADPDGEMQAGTHSVADTVLADEGGLDIRLVRNTVHYGDYMKLEVTGNLEDGEVSFRVISGEEYVNLDGNRLTGTDVGKAAIEVTVAATENFESVTEEFEITISQRPVILFWSYPPLMYNGQEQTPEVRVVNLVGDDECEVTVRGGVNAGNRIVARAVGLSNPKYTLIRGSRLTTKYIIAPLSVDVEWGDTELVFNGKEQAPQATLTGVLPGEECEVYLRGKGIDVGEYKAEAYDVSNGNYSINGAAFATVNYRINVADLDLSLGPKYIVSGVSTDVVLEGNVGDGEVTYTLTNNSGRAEIADGKITGTELGRVYLRAEVAATSNTNAGSALAEIWVLGLSYDSVGYGDEITLSIEGNFGDGEPSYSLEFIDGDDGRAEIVGNVLTGTNVGQVKLIAETSESNGGFGRVERIITITPRIVQLNWSNKLLEYSGEEHKPVANVSNLFADDDLTVVVVGEQIEPGTYTAEATAVLNKDGTTNDNYTLEGAEGLTCSFEIVPGEILGTGKYDFITEIVETIDGLSKHYRTVYYPDAKEQDGDDELAPELVLGHIPVKTSIDKFLNSVYDGLLSEVRLYDSKGNIAYDCGDYGEGYLGYKFVGTGWYVLVGKDIELAEKVKISVLGDVTGDGRITAEDAAAICAVVCGDAQFTEVEFRLAAYVTNIGEVNSSDYGTINAILQGFGNIEDYFSY